MITRTTIRTTNIAITNMTTSTSPVVELSSPDISAYKAGNTSVDYITTFDTGKPGPHVMINAVTHGNEICGAIAVDRLFKMNVLPARGKLSLSFANVEAYLRFDPAAPHTTRYVDEDFNRVWNPETLHGPRHSQELTRARAMRPIIDTVDLLLDIHSMHDPHGAVMICGPLDKGIAFAKDVGIPAHIVSDRGHANGTRMRDYGGFGDAASTKNALLVECGQHWERAAEDVAWQTVWRFLKACDVVDRDLADAQIDPMPAKPQHVVRVTDAVIASGIDFKFADGVHGLSVLPRKGDVIGFDSGKPVLAPYDDCVLIMPTMVHVKPGLTVVRLGRME
jgi:predicted deacylase